MRRCATNHEPRGRDRVVEESSRLSRQRHREVCHERDIDVVQNVIVVIVVVVVVQQGGEEGGEATREWKIAPESIAGGRKTTVRPRRREREWSRRSTGFSGVGVLGARRWMSRDVATQPCRKQRPRQKFTNIDYSIGGTVYPVPQDVKGSIVYQNADGMRVDDGRYQKSKRFEERVGHTGGK